MLIYIDKITPRVNYIFKLVLHELSGISFQFTTDRILFKNALEYKISYSTQKISSEFHIKPIDLLFEKGISDQQIKVRILENKPILFPTNTESDLPFDIFAASFFLVSRYEEYLPFTEDNHGRFSAKESLAFKNGFLELPIINLWVVILQKSLKLKYPSIEFAKHSYNFLPTIDIDNAYAYLHKGFFRTLGAEYKSILKLNFKEAYQRILALIRILPDPYDTYKTLNAIHSKYDLNPVFFFLLADYNKYDKNTPFSKKAFRKLIKQINTQNNVGIHPSYASNNNSNLLKKEIKRLVSVCNGSVNKSRQHFLMLSLPETYRNLIYSGITEDFSMGYADAPGFRAGICNSFNFYDLLAEQETNLRIFPFVVMDTTLRQYLQLTRDESLEKIRELVEKTRQVNGTFISLWHNESLSDEKEWKGWKSIYEDMVKIATKQ